MIRLWNRVGIFRALSALVLLVSAIGGLVLSDRQTQQYRSLSTVDVAVAAPVMVDTADESKQLRQGAREAEVQRQAAAQLAAQQDAQAKADQAARDAAAQAEKAADEARSNEAANRSKDRSAPPTSPSAKATTGTGPKVSVPANCSTYSGNRALGCALVLAAGYGMDQMGCLDKLFTRESGWSTQARNPSGAYGIAQALPGSKMASVASDWATNAATQITWGLGYIKSRYGSPCGAWGHSQSTGWY